MSSFSYETVARFAQQGGTVYFLLLFVLGVAYALSPRHAGAFSKLAVLPLENHEDDHVPS